MNRWQLRSLRPRAALGVETELELRIVASAPTDEDAVALARAGRAASIVRPAVHVT